ncbi:MAG: RNA polymerase sigma factor RpoD/SigA [Planctomycetota bacterium]
MASKKNRQPSLAELLKRLDASGSVSWCDLDPYLDGCPESFPRDVKRLTRKLDRHAVRVAPVLPADPSESGCYDDPYRRQSSLRNDGVSAYEIELNQLPRLNRIGEFRMARRYEFLRSRAQASLRAAGFDPEEADSALTNGERALAPWPRKAERQKALKEAVLLRLQEFEQLRNSFLEGSLYIVMTGIHKYRNLGVDTLDLIQEGNISLFQAVEGFDWRRAVRFKTYAEYWVNQAFLKMLYNNVRTVRVPVWVQKLLKKIKDLQVEAIHRTGDKLSSEQIGRALNIPARKVEDLLRTQRYSISLDQEIGGDEGSRMGDLLEDEESVPVPEQIEDVKLKDRLMEVMETLPERERLILTLRFGLDGNPPKTLFEIGELLMVSAERVRQLQEVALGRLKLPKSRNRLLPFAG